MDTTIQPPQGPRPTPGAPGAPGSPVGAPRMASVYYDDAGHQRKAPPGVLVPTDQFGKIVSVRFRCRRCPKETSARWVQIAIAAKGDPVCDVHGLRMVRMPLHPPAQHLRAVLGFLALPYMRPVVGLAVAALLGLAVSRGHIPWVVLLLLAVPAGLVAAAITRRYRWESPRPRRREDTDELRIRAVAKRSRTVAYCAVLAVLWLTAPAVVGVDPHTLGGRVALTSLVAVWFLPAATWWRRLRKLRDQPPVLAELPEFDTAAVEVPMDPDEAQTRRVWAGIVAVRKDTPLTYAADGSVATKAPRAGKLVETWLEDWHKVKGGWSATIVGPDGLYTGDAYQKSAGAIASAYRMKTPMVTILPDPDDENRAQILAQRTSPIRDVIRWAGPTSFDPVKGTAPVAVYADGEPALYEVYRPGWGTPHVLAIGTPGSGKSEFLNLLLTIGRWASHRDEAGVEHGLVASFLVDPQHGQSFAPFLDMLAGPVASTTAEATVLVKALHQEMLRRNRYLAKEAKTWDARRNRFRTGRKWWNPVIDGPILQLVIDEAHEPLADREFATMVTKSARMWRKCGGQIVLATHTPLLSDLGGSMALRDMLSGGFVAVFRTANSLSGPVAFNGRLSVDPRQIPKVEGSCYILGGTLPKGMLARAMWEPDDWYDWLRDDDDNPIGHPGVLPAETLTAFGPEYARWVEHTANPDAEAYVPTQAGAPVEPEAPATCVDAVTTILAAARLAGDPANYPMGMDALDAGLKAAGHTYSTRTVRGALAQLRKTGHVQTDNGRHSLTTEGEEELAALISSDGGGDPV